MAQPPAVARRVLAKRLTLSVGRPIYRRAMVFVGPVCGDGLIAVPNDDPAYGASTLYFCETAGAAHVPVGWAPDDSS
jgi:hypothetical protein